MQTAGGATSVVLADAHEQNSLLEKTELFFPFAASTEIAICGVGQIDPIARLRNLVNPQKVLFSELKMLFCSNALKF